MEFLWRVWAGGGWGLSFLVYSGVVAWCGWVGVVEVYCCFLIVECFLESCGEFESVVEFVDGDDLQRWYRAIYLKSRVRDLPNTHARFTISDAVHPGYDPEISYDTGYLVVHHYNRVPVTIRTVSASRARHRRVPS